MITHPQTERHAGRFYGKFSGEVVSVDDPDRRGWLTVKVPAVFGSDLEVRARPCFPYGHHFVPPVGAHVWVEFEAGDPRYPLWLGVWYPPDAMPEAVVDPPTNRVIETESGHRIELDDTEDALRLAITHAGGHSIELDDSDDAQRLTIAHASGTTIEIDGDGNLTVTVENNVTVDASGDVEITAQGAVTVSGSEINLN